jgi:hypothetical protein
MKVIKITPDGTVSVIEMESDAFGLDLEEIVDGYAEIITPTTTWLGNERICFLADVERMLKIREYNPVASRLSGVHLVGEVFVVVEQTITTLDAYGTYDLEIHIGLSDEQIRLVQKCAFDIGGMI